MSPPDRVHDWIRVSALTFLIAAAGAVVSIAVTRHRHDSAVTTIVSSTTITRTLTTTTTPTVTTTPAVTSTPATTSAPAPANGRTLWTVGTRDWTVVLGSYPVAAGEAAALANASRAARSGLPDVGVLDSSSYASLHPGYYVVFTGQYGSEAQAQAALRAAAASGFAGAYPRQVSR